MWRNLPAGWLKEEEAEFLGDLVESVANLEGFFLEIGSWLGRSTVVIGKATEKLGGQLYCIDTWNQTGWKEISKTLPNKRRRFQWEKFEGDAYSIFWQNIKKNGLEMIVNPIISRSSDIRKKWDAPIRFIFIDGCHYYQFVKDDSFWKKFLIKDGIIAFHDYDANAWPGVKKAVDEIMDPDKKFKFFKRIRNLKAFKRISK